MSGLDSNRLDAVMCPHCDEVTMPNLLDDGSYICSCTAERALPLETAQGTPWDGEEGVMPAPMDDASFIPDGPPERAMPPGDQRSATPAERRAKARHLPGYNGQFGHAIATEDHLRMDEPPAGPEEAEPGGGG